MRAPCACSRCACNVCLHRWLAHAQVCASNVAWLLDLACFLEIVPLQDACCAFLRGALSPECCVDVLLLAHHYDCSALQAEAVSGAGAASAACVDAACGPVCVLALP